MAPTTITEPRLAASTGPIYLSWAPVVAGAIVSAAVSFLLISFAAGMGLAVASPSATWRDTSATLAIIVPAGTPHRFSQLDGPAIVYLVYRFEVK